MATLKDIRRRITSVEKTRQITKAMRMVAAAKLRRAQERILAARPYAERMREVLSEVAMRQRGADHALLRRRERVRSVEFVVITSDRGLAGAFNANVLKRALGEIEAREAAERGVEVALTLVGRKARDFFRRRRPQQIREQLECSALVGYEHAAQLTQRVAARFCAGESDEVVLVYSEFVSTMTQRPRALRLLPVETPPVEAAAGETPLAYEIEPSEARLLEILVPRAVEVEVYRALLESQAGEHAARMTAMESATRNTEELISSLRLKFNRARQAAITKELVEIVSGAEAL